MIRQGVSRRERFLVWGLPLVVLLLLGMLVMVFWDSARRHAEGVAQRDFDHRARNAAGALEARLNSFRRALLGATGFIEANPNASLAEWNQYGEILDLSNNYPGLIGFAWAPVLREGDQLHAPVQLVAPVDDFNRQAIGFDMYAEPTRRRAMDAAADSGRPVLSAPLEFHLKSVSQPAEKGMLLFMPVYQAGPVPQDEQTRRSRLRGFTHAAIHFPTLMEALPGLVEQTRLFLYDGQGTAQDMLLYSILPSVAANADKHGERFVSVQTIEINGHVLTLRLESPKVQVLPQIAGVDLLLVFGWLLALSIAALVAQLARMQFHAQRLAAKMSSKALSSERQMRIIMDNVPAIISYVDQDNHVLYVNKRHLEWELFGERIEGQRLDERFLSGTDKNPHLQAISEALKGQPQRYEAHIAPDRVLDVTIIPDRTGSDTETEGVFLFASDISDRIQMETRLFAEKERAEVTLRSIGDAVLVTDDRGAISYLNPVAEAMTGWPLAEANGRMIEDVLPLVDDQTREPAVNPLRVAIEKNEVLGMTNHTALITRSGQLVPVEDSAAPIHDREGKVSGGVIVLHDVSESRAMATRISHLAQHDHLTDLPNRVLLQDRLAQAMLGAQHNERNIALMFIDLDNFKTINDSLGHAAGDQLLKQVAARLLETVRDDDTVSRLGGDEFVVLLVRMAEALDVTRVAINILSALSLPFWVDGHELHIGASIGISQYPQENATASDLMKQADTAMYHAKRSGRGCYRFFSAEMSVAADRRLHMERALRAALAENQLYIEYQPKIRTVDNALVGVEALVRWQLPGGIEVPATEFVPLAEETGLIRELDAWVMREACRQCKRWHQMGWTHLDIAVNVSLMRMDIETLHEVIQDALNETGLAPDKLEIELIESEMLRNSEATHAWIRRVKTLGVRIAIDDFGVGYSNLAYLQNFGLDILKIDKSFVHALEHSADAYHLVRAIMAMAHALGYQVVAEGIETEYQAALLGNEGCDLMQGYWFYAPMSADAITALLQSENPLQQTAPESQ